MVRTHSANLTGVSRVSYVMRLTSGRRPAHLPLTFGISHRESNNDEAWRIEEG